MALPFAPFCVDRAPNFGPSKGPFDGPKQTTMISINHNEMIDHRPTGFVGAGDADGAE